MPAADAFDLAGRLVYMLMVDCFVISPASASRACEGIRWCGGNLAAATAQLDYIAGMGYDCVWITPVVAQPAHSFCYDDTDTTDEGCVDGYHGYWGEDLYAIDKHLGTAADLKAFSQGVRDRGMCLMMDTVLHHMRPVSSSADLQAMRPFNETWHYWTRDILPNETFDDYARHPVQALIAGCNPGECADQTQVEQGWFFDLPALKLGDSRTVRDEMNKWIRHMVSEYSPAALRLDTAPYVPFEYLQEFRRAAGVPIYGEVTSGNFSYLRHFIDPSQPNGAPLDAVTHFGLLDEIRRGFCGAGQGFVDDPAQARGIMPGSEDQPHAAHEAPNLEVLRDAIERSLAPSGNDLQSRMRLDELSHFLDTHDEPRFARACAGEQSRVHHAMAFVMTLPGLPVVYYGTEQLFAQQDNRAALWSSGFQRGPTYQLIASLNAVRKQHLNRRAMPMRVAHADQATLVVVRGGKVAAAKPLDRRAGEKPHTCHNQKPDVRFGGRSSSGAIGSSTGSSSGGRVDAESEVAPEVWIFLSNHANQSSPRLYCGSERMPALLPARYEWFDTLTGIAATYDSQTGCFMALDGAPKVLARRRREAAPNSTLVLLEREVRPSAITPGMAYEAALSAVSSTKTAYHEGVASLLPSTTPWNMVKHMVREQGVLAEPSDAMHAGEIAASSSSASAATALLKKEVGPFEGSLPTKLALQATEVGSGDQQTSEDLLAIGTDCSTETSPSLLFAVIIVAMTCMIYESFSPRRAKSQMETHSYFGSTFWMGAMGTPPAPTSTPPGKSPAPPPSPPGKDKVDDSTTVKVDDSTSAADEQPDLPMEVWMAIFVIGFAAWCADVYYSMLAPFMPGIAADLGASTFEINVMFSMQPFAMLFTGAAWPWILKMPGVASNPTHLLMQVTVLNAAIIAAAGLAKTYCTTHHSFVLFFGVTRLLQGAIAGVQEACAETVILRLVPFKHVAMTLGTLEAFRLTSTLAGPAVGGLLYQVGCFPLPFFTSSMLLLLSFLAMRFSFSQTAINAIDQKRPERDISPWTLLCLPGAWQMQCVILPSQLTFTMLEPMWQLFLNEAPFSLNSAGVGGFMISTLVILAVFIVPMAELAAYIGYGNAFAIGACLSPFGYLFWGPSPLISGLVSRSVPVLYVGSIIYCVPTALMQAAIGAFVISLYKLSGFTQEEVAGVSASIMMVTSSLVGIFGPLVSAAVASLYDTAEVFPYLTTFCALFTFFLPGPLAVYLAWKYSSPPEKQCPCIQRKAEERGQGTED
jgi:alpha-amylase